MTSGYEHFSAESGRRLASWLLLFSMGLIGFSGLFSAWRSVPFSEGFLITLEILSFAPPDPLFPLERVVQVGIMLLGAFFAWFLLWNTLDLILEGKLKEYGVELMQKMRRIGLNRHVVVLGGGRVGSYTAELLEKRGERVVIVESDEGHAKNLEKRFSVVRGDVLDETVLKKARLSTAKSVVCALADTEKNVLAILLAKSMNPGAVFLARCEHPSLISSLHKAGVHHVIMPEHAAAEQFTQLVLSGDEKRLVIKTAKGV